MDLSDEQMGSAMFGARGVECTWEPIALPEGPRPIPAWCTGLHVDFVDAYSNAPRFKLKTTSNVRDWPDKRFERKGRLFLAVAPDGRAEAYYHDSALRPTMLRRFRCDDGRLLQYRPSEPRDNPSSPYVLSPGEWVEVERLATTQQEGFGGAHIDIIMADGTEATLRGPWHGGAPEGFVETAYVDMSSPYCGRPRSGHSYRWYNAGGVGDLFIAEAAFIDIFARFAPHLTLAHVHNGLGVRVQPLKPEWSEPKDWVMARERLASATERFLALPPEQRPASVLCGWWKLCAGKTACASIQKDKCPIHLPGDTP